MTLRQKLLLLAGVTLLLPVSAWLLLRELEGFLRDGHQQSLQATAETVARSVSPLLEPKEAPVALYATPLTNGSSLDGFSDDWPEIQADGVLRRGTEDGALSFELQAGAANQQIYLLFTVKDRYPVRRNLNLLNRDSGQIEGAMDGIQLSVTGHRGLFQFLVTSAGSGPLTLQAAGSQGQQISGYWLDRSDGYRLELALPAFMADRGLSFRLVDADDPAVPIIEREINQPFIPLVGRAGPVQAQLETLIAAGQKAWVVDTHRWVKAVGGALDDLPSPNQASWAQRLFHRLLTVDQSPARSALPDHSSRLGEPLLGPALQGRAAGAWRQIPDTAALLNTVAVPLLKEGRITGALLLEAPSDGLLLLTNRALIRVLAVSVATMLVLALALYLFASRLSARVLRLNRAVADASTDPAQPQPELPLLKDRDELGQLARGHGELLRAVREYNTYLKTLAGKLSHELKTPLVIVQSSLENLEREHGQLDAAPGGVYLKRAQEGSSRLAGILRAMGDASRLEQAIASMERERFDLVSVVTQAANAYRQAFANRRITTDIAEPPMLIDGAPELISQLLDKLVDNAVSFTGPDDTITIALRPHNDWAWLSVANSGSRLPQTMQGQLFESLVTVRDSKGEQPHLGLGLYLVKLIADAHDGKVSAYNRENDGGVEFRVGIPLQKTSQ